MAFCFLWLLRHSLVLSLFWWWSTIIHHPTNKGGRRAKPSRKELRNIRFCRRYYCRHAPLLPLFRRKCDHRIPYLHIAGPDGLWGSVESTGTCLATRIVVSLDRRVCQSFQTVCSRKTGTSRLPGDLVFLRSRNCEIHPAKTPRAEFRTTRLATA